MAKIITLNEAIERTHAFQNSSLGQEQTISATIEKEELLQILDQPKCVGLRIYNALENDNKINFVLIGYDQDGNDMTSGIIMNYLSTCPPECKAVNSPLVV